MPMGNWQLSNHHNFSREGTLNPISGTRTCAVKHKETHQYFTFPQIFNCAESGGILYLLYGWPLTPVLLLLSCVHLSAVSPVLISEEVCRRFCVSSVCNTDTTTGLLQPSHCTFARRGVFVQLPGHCCSNSVSLCECNARSKPMVLTAAQMDG